MGERISDEVYECAGCAGDVPVVDAVWLPEPRPSKVDASKARPYCCRECFEAHQKEVHKMDRTVENLLALSKRIVESDILRPTIEYCCRECFEAHQKEVRPVDDLAALRTRADTLAAEVERLRGALEDIAARLRVRADAALAALDAAGKEVQRAE